MDYGTQKSELFSPQVFKEQYVPNMRRINDCLHEHSNCKSFYHSCGAISNLIPHMIEGGVDILNPVQTSATGMDAATLKEKFGDKIVFWGGGADTQQVLHRVSPEEVRLHVKERVEIFKKGGGYVFSQIHNLQYGVPPENIAAMVEAALEYGVY
jgi:uroporphyrinogen decarboxylase